MIYAVIDTNVLVAAVKTTKPDSATSQILSLVFTGVIRPLVSEEILTEYHDILNLPVLELDAKKVADVLEKFSEDGLYLEFESRSLRKKARQSAGYFCKRPMRFPFRMAGGSRRGTFS